ncbi:hypothetical protein LTR66_010341 [Elasticomyces elasticus]|nr:hypothetical protein LTR66_010341 [Elasticomyces elasticus]
MTTITIKTDIISLINQRMADPLTRTDDLNITLLVQLLACEMATGDTQTQTLHVKGIQRMVELRGGSLRLSLNSEITFVTACLILYFCVLNELQTPSNYLDFLSVAMSRTAPLRQYLFESPVFCLYEDFIVVLRSENYPTYLYDLLYDMCDLTEMFLYRHNCTKHIAAIANSNRTNAFDGGKTYSRTTDYELRAAEIQRRLITRPAANTSNNPVSGDWAYECIRLTALIYTTALLRCTPFSVAAPLTTDPYTSTPSIIKSLGAALIKAYKYSCWADMPGCLLWVGVVGGAAARPARDECRNQEDDMARMWLAMVAIGCSLKR